MDTRRFRTTVARSRCWLWSHFTKRLRAPERGLHPRYGVRSSFVDVKLCQANSKATSRNRPDFGVHSLHRSCLPGTYTIYRCNNNNKFLLLASPPPYQLPPASTQPRSRLSRRTLHTTYCVAVVQKSFCSALRTIRSTPYSSHEAGSRRSVFPLFTHVDAAGMLAPNVLLFVPTMFALWWTGAGGLPSNSCRNWPLHFFRLLRLSTPHAHATKSQSIAMNVSQKMLSAVLPFPVARPAIRCLARPRVPE